MGFLAPDPAGVDGVNGDLRQMACHGRGGGGGRAWIQRGASACAEERGEAHDDRLPHGFIVPPPGAEAYPSLSAAPRESQVQVRERRLLPPRP